MDYVASLLNIQNIEAYEVASFYSMFNLQPVGKCLIEVCRTSSCWLRGANEVIQHLENKLGIKEGETSADGMFTLKAVECLGSCGTAPMMMIGAQFHENLTHEKVDAILETCKQEGKRKTYLDNVVVDKY
jgi:NADH-quinone oxidoreductase subunit E